MEEEEAELVEVEEEAELVKVEKEAVHAFGGLGLGPVPAQDEVEDAVAALQKYIIRPLPPPSSFRSCNIS